MKTVYVITMWSGGRAAKKWKSDAAPETLAQGTGVSFISTGTRLRVSIIGNISIEEYESGKEELEMGLNPDGSADLDNPVAPRNIERIF
jgi:hypothetical protein